MEIVSLVSVSAAIVSACMGLLGLLAPQKALSLIGLRTDDRAPHGLSEVRATYGGLFFAMSLLAIATGEPFVYSTVGTAWLGASAGRVLSIVADGVRTKHNFAGVGFEGGLGLLLLTRLV